MTTDLKACPFCNMGSSFGPNDAVSYVVRCRHCGARGPVVRLPDDNPRRFTMEEIEEGIKLIAAAGWNRRGSRMPIVSGDAMLDLRSGQLFKVTGSDRLLMACREIADEGESEFRDIPPGSEHYRHLPTYDKCRRMVRNRHSAWMVRCARYPQAFGEEYCWQHSDGKGGP